MSNSIDVYGSFSECCDISVAGTYKNGWEFEDIVDNSFLSRKEALKSIKDWAKREQVGLDEICFF